MNKNTNKSLSLQRETIKSITDRAKSLAKQALCSAPVKDLPQRPALWVFCCNNRLTGGMPETFKTYQIMAKKIVSQKEERGMRRVFCTFVRRNGKIYRPKRGKYFTFLVKD